MRGSENVVTWSDSCIYFRKCYNARRVSKADTVEPPHPISDRQTKTPKMSQSKALRLEPLVNAYLL